MLSSEVIDWWGKPAERQQNKQTKIKKTSPPRGQYPNLFPRDQLACQGGLGRKRNLQKMNKQTTKIVEKIPRQEQLMDH